MRVLESYRWPGNVRELENVVERALALTTSSSISVRDIPESLRVPARRKDSLVELPAEGMNIEDHLEDIRRQLMSQALQRTGGVQTKAAELLGMSFRSFRYYSKKVALSSSETPEPETVAVGD